MENKKDKKIFVLSFDGGGSRMVLQYTLIKRIIAKFPCFLPFVDVFAGVSAGSFIASLLACRNLDEISRNLDEISEQNVASIFSNTFGRRISSLEGLIKSKYSNENLRFLLQESLGEESFCNLKKGLYITSFNTTSTSIDPVKEGPKWMGKRVNRWQPVYHHNLDDCYVPEKIKDAVLKSCSAPCYFPIVNGHVDGGMVNNTACLSVYSTLVSLGYSSENIYILSIGSGENPKVLDVPIVEDTDWGFLKWAPHLLDLMFDGTSEETAHICYNLLGDRFWRVQPVLDTQINLNDYSQFNHLIEIANNHDMENTFNWIETTLESEKMKL